MNVMGGSEIWRFNASLSYDETVGVMKGSDRANFNGSLGITYQGEKLIVSENLSVGTNNNANSPYGDFSSFAAMNRYWEPQDEEGEPILTYTHPLRSETSYSDNPAYNALVGVWNKTRYTNMRSATQVRYNINESFFAVQKLIGYLVSYVSRKQF